jgi:IS5 family transposase
MVGCYQKGSLPLPVNLGITDAGTADIKVLNEIEQGLPKGLRLFADKAYQKGNQPIAQKERVTLYTPVKKGKGQELLDAADSLLSTAISRVRQPIESLFSWIEEKTNIQIAGKVRSYEGLMVHIFGKIAAALLMLQQRFCS